MNRKGMTPQKAAKIREKRGIQDTKLQRLRVKKGLSQSELAALSNVPIRRIQHYEQRVRPIDGARLETLCALCIALDCKIEDILESKETIKLLRMTR